MIEVEDDELGDWSEDGPQNPAKACGYMEKIDNIFNTFGDTLQGNMKDVVHSIMMSFKKILAKHWPKMVEAEVEVVMKSVRNTSCVYLCQHLTPEEVNMMEPEVEILVRWEFLRHCLNARGN